MRYAELTEYDDVTFSKRWFTKFLGQLSDDLHDIFPYLRKYKRYQQEYPNVLPSSDELNRTMSSLFDSIQSLAKYQFKFKESEREAEELASMIEKLVKVQERVDYYAQALDKRYRSMSDKNFFKRSAKTIHKNIVDVSNALRDFSVEMRKSLKNKEVQQKLFKAVKAA